METINADRSDLVKRALFLIVTIISIMLTSVFFVGHFQFAGLYAAMPLANYVLILIIGLVAADLGALAWRHIYMHNCETARQVNVAQAMVFLTLTVTTLTTFGGLADALTSGTLIPATLNAYINWVILGVVALQFIAGAFYFDLAGAQLTIQREIIGAITTEAQEVVNAVRTSMADSRPQRVLGLTAAAASHADGLIHRTLFIHGGGRQPTAHPAVAPLRLAAESPAPAPRFQPRALPGPNAAPADPDPDCNLIAWADGQLPVVIDVGAQTTLTAEIAPRRAQNPGLHYAIITASDLRYIDGDQLPDFFGRSQTRQ